MAVVRDTIAKEGAWTSRKSGQVIDRLGNPNGAAALIGRRGSQANAVAGLVRKADAHAAQVRPIVEAIRAEGVETLSGIARELTARGVLTARGGAWDASRVRCLLLR